MGLANSESLAENLDRQITIPIKVCTCFLQISSGIDVIADTLVCDGLYPLIMYVSPKKSTSVFCLEFVII